MKIIAIIAAVLVVGFLALFRVCINEAAEVPEDYDL